MSNSARTIARVVATLVVVAMSAGVLAGLGHGKPRRHVPNVMGKTKAAALTLLAEHDLRAEIVVDPRASLRLSADFAGRVVHQTWDRGMALPKGGVLRLTMSPKGRGQAHR